MDIKQLASVKAALSQVASETTVNNGTNGMKVMCHLWDVEDAFDQKKQDLEKAAFKALLESRLDDVVIHHKAISELPPAKKTLIFKLLQPIPTIRGTKVVIHEGKSRSPIMTNVDMIYLSEDAASLGLIDVRDTSEKAKDHNGMDVEIVELTLLKGIIDVKEAKYNRQNQLMRAARANITPISYKSMQVVGKLLYAESEAKRKLFGFGDIQHIVQ